MAVGVIEVRDDFTCDGIEFKRRDDNTKEVFTSLVRLKGSKAVSYTHLDVYKRQSLNRATSCML